MDDRARALLDALNELCDTDWVCRPGEAFYTYRLVRELPDREPFEYQRAIRPSHIHSDYFRTALQFVDEASERLGRYLLLKPEGNM